MSIEFSDNRNINYNSQIELEDQRTRGQDNEDPLEFEFTSETQEESPESANRESVSKLFADIFNTLGLTEEEIKELGLDVLLNPEEELEETVIPDDEEPENQDENPKEGDPAQVSDGIIGDFEQNTDASMGDCWFLSAIVAANDTPEGKQMIKDSIVDNGDGTYAVTFAGDPSGKTYTVTDEDLANVNSSGDIDVAILEEAARQYYQENEGRDIGEGGMEEGISLLTGLKVDSHDANSDPAKLKEDLINMGKEHAENGGDGAVMMFATDTWLTAEGEVHKNGDKGMGHMMAITDINEEENTISYVDPYDSKTIITQNLDDFAKLQSEVKWTGKDIPAQIFSAPGEMKVHPKIQELANSIDQGEAESLLEELDLEKGPDGKTTNMALYNVVNNISGNYTDEQRAAAFRLLETK